MYTCGRFLAEMNDNVCSVVYSTIGLGNFLITKNVRLTIYLTKRTHAAGS